MSPTSSGYHDLAALPPNGFELLLQLLDEDPLRAEREYFKLRSRLDAVFSWRGVRNPEDAVDETISRVALRLEQGVEITTRNPHGYIDGFARLIAGEAFRDEQRLVGGFEGEGMVSLPTPIPEEPSLKEQALEHCLQELPGDQADLLLAYFDDEGRSRIEARRSMAQRLGLKASAFRLRMFRLRRIIEHCVRDRLNRVDRVDRPDR